MDREELVQQILKQVLAKLTDMGEKADAACVRPDAVCPAAHKPGLLILTQEHGVDCHAKLEDPRLQERYGTQCALMADYAVDIADVEVVILYQLSIEALCKLSSGLCDTPYTRLAQRAILSGKRIYVPTQEVELLQNNTMPAAYRAMLQKKLELLEACGNGSSELMSNISSSLVGMLYNFQLMRLIGEDGVSAYGVLMYVQFIFVAIFIGYSIGSAPVVSFHYGAQHHSELKNLLRKSALLMAIGGVTLTVLARVLAAPLSRLFVGYDASLYALTTHAFRLFCWSFLLAGFNIFASGFFTALNNGAVSAAISFLRTLVFQAGSVVVLPILLGVDGIWWAITAAEIFAFIISGVFLVLKRNTYHYM